MAQHPVDTIATVRIPLFILKCVGLWRWTAPSSADHANFVDLFLQRGQRIYRLLLQLPLTFVVVALMWTEAFIAQSIEQAGSVLYLSLAEVGLIAKILHMWCIDGSAWRFIHELEHLPELRLSSNAAARAVWRREQRKFVRIALLHIGGSMTIVAFAFLVSLMLAQHEIPFGYYVPLDMRLERNFWIAFIYDFFAVGLTGLSNSTLDIFYCYCLFHISLLYRLIGLQLEALEEVSEAVALKELRRIFKLQQRVKRLTAQCEAIVSLPILAQIMLSAFIICFCAYRMQSMSFTDDPVQFAITLQFVFIMMLQIFMPCYFGNEVTIHSNALTNSAYNCKWLRFSPKTRKLLFIYMEFLKRPVKLRAGGFFEIGLPIFTKTINNAYSLLALLLNMEK